MTRGAARAAVLPLAAGGIAADAGVSAAVLVLAALLGGCAVLLWRQGRARAS